MTATYQTLLSNSFLRAELDRDYQAFRNTPADAALLARLKKWSGKEFQKETSAEIAFVNVFFEETWGYTQSGKVSKPDGFTCYPKFPVPGAGAGGSSGEADAALGIFGRADLPPTPQVLCEFKDVRSNLDAPQKRKGSNRSPVKQCADYLREAMKPFYGNEAILPTWGIVTDMNEFRLYWRNTMPSYYQRFIINKATTDEGVSLLEESDDGSFQRFIFAELFHAHCLLTSGGQSPLLRLLKDQRFQQKEIENAFYREYRAFREHLVNVLIQSNPSFVGTKGRLVRLAQKLIDRCIFVMFCEDMGEQLSFPPHALRDYLSELSKSTTFESDEQDAWNKLKELFHAMNEGKKFRSRPINRFNGGLFADDQTLDSLTIPNAVFCANLQGESDDALKSHKHTLLYFAGAYNFGTAGREGQAITLYTLGRIFEQSITELEVLEAQAEDRPSLNLITKRKRDGVYYTPEWVVERIVAETLGTRLDEIRVEVGWNFEIEGDEEIIAKQVARSPSDRTQKFKDHVEAVRKFRDRLDSFTVLDPACGSGAFLIYSLEYLLRERRRVLRELALVTGGKGQGLFEFKDDEEIRHILSKNIFGVDINSASVEIARLALWLHTAKSDQPLSNLDTNIVEGNSLVGKEVYDFKKDLLGATAEKKEIINAFDYEDAFSTVFDAKRPAGKGFDCVVGNPPYVKLQNFKKVYPETADFLRNSLGKGGLPRYQSCQTGSFDLYLPFIERGLELLNERGRLGFIAPSLWRYNEYGEGLRKLLHTGGHLDRWIDFGSYQVFDEAIIYTALQFYSRARNDSVRFALAPTGELTRIHDWDDPNWFVNYSELPKEDAWILVPRSERAVLNKLHSSCRRLDDRTVAREIYQGLITSADHIYHLHRLGKNRYQYQPPKPEGAKKRPPPEEVAIEDAIMHPLVSGPEANRYQVPVTSTYILFPYRVKGSDVHLFTCAEMRDKFPMAWAFLKRFEKPLRGRENNAFNDGKWYRFGRHQNIDKQEDSKLIVAQTVKQMSVCPDESGAFYLNNVRVNGILPAKQEDFWYLLGIMNSQVVDWVFRRIAKPKEGGYFEANRQFIAPLPIAKAGAKERTKIANAAKELTDLHTQRRDTIEALEQRFEACDLVEKPEEWLWPASVQTLDALKGAAPKGMKPSEKTRWAKEQRSAQIDIAVQTLQEGLRVGGLLEVQLGKGELRLMDEDTVVLAGVYVDEQEAQQIAIDWRNYLRARPVTEETKAAELSGNLRLIRKPNSSTVAKQMSELDQELSKLDASVAEAEAKLNLFVCDIYSLTDVEIALLQKPSL